MKYSIILILLLAFTAFGQAIPANLPDKVKTIDYHLSAFQVVSLLESLEKFIIKDEFESKAEYKTRLKKFLNDVYVSRDKKTTLGSTFILVKPEIDYNAETKSFVIPDYGSLTIDSGYTPHSKLILLKDISVGMFDEAENKMSVAFNLPIPAAQAKLIKDDLSLLMRGMAVKYDHSSDTLYFIPSDYLIFNKKSGEVYQKNAIPNNAK